MLLRSTCFSRHQGRVFNHGRRRCSAATDCPDEAVAASVVSAVPLLVVVSILRGALSSVDAKIFSVPSILDRPFFVVYRSRASTMPSSRALAKLRSSAAQPGAVIDASPWPPFRPRALLQVSLPTSAPGRNAIVFSVAKSVSFFSSVERSAAAAPTNFRVKYVHYYATDRYRR